MSFRKSDLDKACTQCSTNPSIIRESNPLFGSHRTIDVSPKRNLENRKLRAAYDKEKKNEKE